MQDPTDTPDEPELPPAPIEAPAADTTATVGQPPPPLASEPAELAPTPPPPRVMPPPPAATQPATLLPPGVLYQVGDISVTADAIITPNGTAPLRGSTWIVADQSYTQERIPGWAIFMAILFFMVCLLGLFFLLVKERTTTGYAEVRVHSGNFVHMSQLPVQSPHQVHQVRQQVANIQMVARSA